MPIVNKDVDGLAGLLAAVLDISGELPTDHFLWFRGVANADHELTPKIMREGRTAEQVFEREKRLLTRFRQRSMAYWPAGYPQSDWEHLFAMQHFGIPTRLLDWSENVFVAAHFALNDLSAESLGENNRPSIWCVDPISWNRSTPVLSEFGETVHVLTTSDDEADAYRPESTKRRKKSPIAIFGAHNSGRIVAQRGTFMVWGNDTRNLEAFAAETTCTLWKLSIAGDRAALNKHLAALGFGETMVFPELQALATELSRTEGWRS